MCREDTTDPACETRLDDSEGYLEPWHLPMILERQKFTSRYVVNWSLRSLHHTITLNLFAFDEILTLWNISMNLAGKAKNVGRICPMVQKVGRRFESNDFGIWGSRGRTNRLIRWLLRQDTIMGWNQIRSKTSWCMDDFCSAQSSPCFKSNERKKAEGLHR